MSDWKEGFQQALQKVLLEHGTLMAEHTTYGRIHWLEGQLHAKRYDMHNGKRRISSPEVPEWCGAWESVTDLHEESWSEFQDTFSENSDKEILVATVSCRCGFITNERLEYEASLSELISVVMRAAVFSDEQDPTVDLSRRYGMENYRRKDS